MTYVYVKKGEKIAIKITYKKSILNKIVNIQLSFHSVPLS